MNLIHNLWALAVLIFMINMPFGFWRGAVRRFSISWFAAIHIPVLLAVGIRVIAGVPFGIDTFPIFAGAFFLGQYLGGAVRTSFVRSYAAGKEKNQK